MNDGTLTWGRCAGCEREVHSRCCSEEALVFCLECAGATDEELFDWVNDLKLQVQAARREKEEAMEVRGRSSRMPECTGSSSPLG